MDGVEGHGCPGASRDGAAVRSGWPGGEQGDGEAHHAEEVFPLGNCPIQMDDTLGLPAPDFAIYCISLIM